MKKKLFLVLVAISLFIGSLSANQYSVTFQCGRSAMFSCAPADFAYMMRVLENSLCGRTLAEN